MDLIKELNKETLANEVAPVQIGDTVRVLSLIHISEPTRPY